MKSSRRTLLKGETRHARQLPTVGARTCPGSLSSIYKKKSLTWLRPALKVTSWNVSLILNSSAQTILTKDLTSNSKEENSITWADPYRARIKY